MAILPHYNVIIKKLKKLLKLKKIHVEKKHIKVAGKTILWFGLGSMLGLLFFVSFLYFFYEKIHTNRIYDGVLVDGVNFSGRNPEAVTAYFGNENKTIQKTTIIIRNDQLVATISAKQIGFGYDANLLATQA